MIIMAANAAGIAGAQVFRTGDAPLYLHAFTALLVLSAASLVIVIGLMAWYVISNRRMAKNGPEVIAGTTGGTEVKRNWWWIW